MTTQRQFFIVNDFDRPCEDLIAELVDGKLLYANAESHVRNWKEPMSVAEATPLDVFGVVWTIYDERFYGELAGDSLATYRDGRHRKWQGSRSFDFALRPPKSASRLSEP